jgi:polysaccharide pyruvyl transferase WcaK-like protein
MARDTMTKAVLDELALPAVTGVDCALSLQDIAFSIPPASGRNPTRVIVAVTGRSKSHLQDLSAAVQRLRSCADEIALLTTCETEDRNVFEAISTDLGIAYYAPQTWQEVVAEFKASAIVVTNRLHALILGAFAGTLLLP